MPALHLDAELVIAYGSVTFALVAQGNQVVLSFRNLADLERLIGGAGPPDAQSQPAPKSNSGAGNSGGGLSGGLQMLTDLNNTVRALGLEVKIVVAGKSYLELGGKSYRITMAAVLGKLGSFFKSRKRRFTRANRPKSNIAASLSIVWIGV